MLLMNETLWAGTEASLNAAARAEEMILDKISASGYGDEDEEEIPRLLTVQDGVATLSIKGPLVNSGSYWNRYFGVVGYPEIREALVHAAKDTSIKRIVVDMDSGGGAVSGLDDTAQLLTMINKSVKPISVFSGGSMYSAAYWLASGAGEIHASRGAGVGSIGVIAFHMERSKQLESEGITVTVRRAGEFKALVNQVEPLTKEALKQLDAQINMAYDLFTSHVAEGRGKSQTYVDTVMGQGREFYGQAAADAGLVDSITTYSEFMSRMIEKTVDSSTESSYTAPKQATGLRASNGDDQMGTQTLTEQDIAALAAGAATAPVGAAADTATDTAADVETTETTAETQTTEAAVPASTDTLKFVSDQLKASQAELLEARVEISRTQEKLNEVQALLQPLQDIAAKAVNNMRIACRATALDMSAMTAAQVVAEHKAIVATFTKQFPVGGVASADPDKAATANKAPAISAFARARARATSF